MIAPPSDRCSRIYITEEMFQKFIWDRSKANIKLLTNGTFIWVFYEGFPRRLFCDPLRGAYLEKMTRNTYPLRLEPYSVHHIWMYGHYYCGLWRIEGEVDHHNVAYNNRPPLPGGWVNDSYPALSSKSTFQYLWDEGWANIKFHYREHAISKIKPATPEEVEKFNAGLDPRHRRLK